MKLIKVFKYVTSKIGTVTISRMYVNDNTCHDCKTRKKTLNYFVLVLTFIDSSNDCKLSQDPRLNHVNWVPE